MTTLPSQRDIDAAVQFSKEKEDKAKKMAEEKKKINASIAEKNVAKEGRVDLVTFDGEIVENVKIVSHSEWIGKK